MVKQRGEDRLTTDQNKRKAKCIAMQRIEYNQKIMGDQNRRKKLSRNKRKMEDPAELKKYEINVQKKQRKLYNAADSSKNQPNSMQTSFAAAVTGHSST